MALPAGGPYIGDYSASGASLILSATLAAYTIDGIAFVPSSGGATNCNPSELKTQTYALSNDFSISVGILAFAKCH